MCEYYVGVIERLFGSACVYGQVLKTRRNDRVVRVERRRRIGTAGRLKAALWESEDSETLNTSFVERLNLTIRQGSAYVRRRSPCHARGADQIRGHVDLLRCSYNFIRPHRALKFGRETRTPAMQAGLVNAPMNWSDIFTAPAALYAFYVAVVRVPGAVQLMHTSPAALSSFSPGRTAFGLPHAACGAPRRHTMPSAPAVVKRGGGAGRTSVSQSWKVTGHFVRLDLRPRCPGNGDNRRIL